MGIIDGREGPDEPYPSEAPRHQQLEFSFDHIGEALEIGMVSIDGLGANEVL
jgi:hypothetical protein